MLKRTYLPQLVCTLKEIAPLKDFSNNILFTERIQLEEAKSAGPLHFNAGFNAGYQCSLGMVIYYCTILTGGFEESGATLSSVDGDSAAFA